MFRVLRGRYLSFFKKKRLLDPFGVPERTNERYFNFKWVAFAIPAVSFGLGCWQVKRLEWKTNLLAMLKERTSSEPIDLPDDLNELKDLEYRPMKVRGHFLHDKEVVVGPRALVREENNKMPTMMVDTRYNQGWWVITPFQLDDRDLTILVNRGWIPKPLKNKDQRPQGLVEGEIELVGIYRGNENRPNFLPKNQPQTGQWFYRDVFQMAQMVNCDPIWLDARGPNVLPDGYPIPNQTRVNLRNEHLSYIITWFGLSGITSWMWYRHWINKLPLL